MGWFCGPSTTGGQEKASGSPDLELQAVNNCMTFVLRPNSGLLQEQQAHLTAEPPLQQQRPISLSSLLFHVSFPGYADKFYRHNNCLFVLMFFTVFITFHSNLYYFPRFTSE